MKSMKKLVAALLVLTMVLALAGNAFAACKFEKYDFVKFTKNATAYEKKDAKKTSTIVRKASVAEVLCVKGSWVRLRLTRWTTVDTKTESGNYEKDGKKCWVYWFKAGDVKKIDKEKYIEKNGDVKVTFSQGGNGKSKPGWLDDDDKIVVLKDKGTWLKDADDDDWDAHEVRISKDCMKHVKATAKVWMHRTPSLSNSYGKALHKGDKVKYLRVWSPDTRGTKFLKIRYKSTCLWVSEDYVKFVK